MAFPSPVRFASVEADEREIKVRRAIDIFFHFFIGISSFSGIKKDKFQMAAAHSASAANKENRNFIDSGKAFRDYWKNVMPSWLTPCRSNPLNRFARAAHSEKKLLCHRQRESYVIHSVPDHRTCEPASLQLTALFLIYALAKKTKVEFSARVEMKNGKAVRRPNYSV